MQSRRDFEGQNLNRNWSNSGVDESQFARRAQEKINIVPSARQNFVSSVHPLAAEPRFMTRISQALIDNENRRPILRFNPAIPQLSTTRDFADLRRFSCLQSSEPQFLSVTSHSFPHGQSFSTPSITRTSGSRILPTLPSLMTSAVFTPYDQCPRNWMTIQTANPEVCYDSYGNPFLAEPFPGINHPMLTRRPTAVENQIGNSSLSTQNLGYNREAESGLTRISHSCIEIKPSATGIYAASHASNNCVATQPVIATETKPAFEIKTNLYGPKSVEMESNLQSRGPSHLLRVPKNLRIGLN